MIIYISGLLAVGKHISAQLKFSLVWPASNVFQYHRPTDNRYCAYSLPVAIGQH